MRWGALRAIPFAALDEISFKRDAIGEANVEARLRLTFYLTERAGSGAMKTKHLIMGAALVGAAALVAFGDRNPDSGVAEPVARAVPRVDPGLAQRAQTPGAAAALPRRSKPARRRPAPRPRRTSCACCRAMCWSMRRAGKEGADVFGSRDWTPPPPPPPAPRRAAAATAANGAAAAVHPDR